MIIGLGDKLYYYLVANIDDVGLHLTNNIQRWFDDQQIIANVSGGFDYPRKIELEETDYVYLLMKYT